METDPRRLGPGEGHSPAPATEDDEKYGAPVDLSRVLRCLLAARWWLLGAFVVGALIGLPVAKFAIKRSYTATAMLRFGGLPVVDGLPAPSDATQTVGGLLQGIFVEGSLREIGARSGFDVPTYVLSKWITIDADPAQVVRISAKATEADEAARFANTVVEVFLERQKEAQRSRIREAIGSIDERLAAAQTAVGAARTSYDTFRNQHGISDLTTEQETAIEQAAELRATRDRTESEIAALEARVEQLRRDIRTTPRTSLSSASVGASAEETERARLQSELATARSSLSDAHPRVQALRQQIAALDERIRSGQAERTRSATSTASTQYMSLQGSLSQSQADLEAAKQRLEGMTRLAREAQERVEQFSSIEGDASQLLAEVRVNEQLMQELQTRKARLEDALRDPDHGFQMMSEATPPELPEASKKKYIVAAGFPLGFLFLVFAVVIARELRGLKIRTAKEVAFWGRGPVVGTSTWPRVPEAIDDLVADLDDFVPTAAGKMLVVGLGEGATDLAMRFASRLSNDWVDTTVVGGSPFDEPDLRAPSLPPDAGGHGGRGPHAIALAGRTHHVDQLVSPELQVEAWEGADSGPALRRAARLADRVCVIVLANVTSALELKDVRTRLGRDRGVGYVLIDVADEYAEQNDRIGPVDAFWACVRE